MKTILLVEDERLIILEKTRFLKKCGFAVITAADGVEAIKQGIETPDLDLILIDIQLGDGPDGLQAAQEILRERELPIIFFTAHSDPETFEKIRPIPHYGYVSKSTGNPVLLSSIEMALTLFEAHQKLGESERRVRVMYDLAQRRAKEAELLDLVRTAVARELDPFAVIRRAVDGIASAFGFPLVSLYLLNGDLLTLQYQVGYESVFREIPIACGVIGKVVRSGKPILLQDIRTDPDFLKAFSGITSEVCVPLVFLGEVQGAFNVETRQDIELTEDDLRLLTALGEHISFSLERARMFAELQEKSRYLSLLNDITRSSLQAKDLSTLLQVVADHLGELLHADGCFISLWDDFHQAAIPAAAYGELRQTYPTNPAIPGEVTMTESVLRAGHPLAADDVFHSPYISPRIAQKYPSRSLLGLPLAVDGQKLGAAMIGFDQPHHFTAAEIASGEQAAGQIALAIARLRLSITDPLTNLYNRRGLSELGNREVERFHRYGTPLSLLLVDIDQFKQVNDLYNHTAGDQVLRGVVDLCRKNTRLVDTLGRYGGDEFAILLPECGPELAKQVADRLCCSIRQTPIPVEKGQVSVTVSVGVASIHEGIRDLDALFSLADDAMYAAKHASRDQVIQAGGCR